ncbi:mycothiol-dependent nitroreductase Rv2466c family protein [Amycolatopsis sp. NPDC004378]
MNAHLDYETHFPPEYPAQHTAGLRLLRVASAAREQHGREAIGPLYAAFGARVFEAGPDEGKTPGWQGTPDLAADAGLPVSLADALDDDRRDAEIQAESDEALSLTGKDVGTPVIHFEPPASRRRSRARPMTGTPGSRRLGK